MEKVRWGLIGAGDIARKRVAPALRDGKRCELVSVARSNAELARSFAEEFGVQKWFGDWRELVADDGIDAVYVATPVYLHAEQTVAAAEAGKHVLCEKPMALTVTECDAMIAACRRNGVKLGIAYYRHFYPSIARIKEVIASGEIGKVSYVQINAFEHFDVPVDHPRGWFLDKARSGGGPMMDFGCHRIEALLNLFGEVRRVESIVSNAVYGRGVEDTAIVLFQFDGGASATLAVTHATGESVDTAEIFGTNGSIHVPSLNASEITISGNGTSRVESHPTAANIHQPLIEDFADAVIEGREPRVNGEAGRAVSVILDEIYKRGS
jgi:predicted dehydrogenase